MLAGIRDRLTYANVMSTIAVFGVLAGGGAWAASKIGPNDIANDAVRSKHVKNDQIKGPDIAAGAVGSPEILNGSIQFVDIATGGVFTSNLADNAVNSAKVFDNSLTGADINESTLNFGCQTGRILGFARVKGSASMPSTYTSDSAYVDFTHNCSGGAVQVRRPTGVPGTGVYFVRFADNPAALALAASNTDGLPEFSSGSTTSCP